MPDVGSTQTRDQQSNELAILEALATEKGNAASSQVSEAVSDEPTLAPCPICGEPRGDETPCPHCGLD